MIGETFYTRKVDITIFTVCNINFGTGRLSQASITSVSKFMINTMIVPLLQVSHQYILLKKGVMSVITS